MLEKSTTPELQEIDFKEAEKHLNLLLKASGHLPSEKIKELVTTASAANFDQLSGLLRVINEAVESRRNKENRERDDGPDAD